MKGLFFQPTILILKLPGAVSPEQQAAKLADLYNEVLLVAKVGG
jgi:hypothetical protein